MLIADDMRLGLDPALLGQAVGLDLDEWQAELLRTRPKKALLCCSRQSGKSTTVALLALWQAVFDPGLVIVVSPSQRQSAELFRTIMQYRELLGTAPPLVSESILKAEFKNGSRILALPGSQKTVRGLSAVKLAIVDEAAQVPDDLLGAIRPMLGVSNGSLIMLSTPKGRRGVFYDAWHSEDQGWLKIRVAASECPRLSREFLEAEMKALGPSVFNEEYCLAFTDSAESMFPSHLIERAFELGRELRPLW